MEACHSFRTQQIETEAFQWFGDLVYAALSFICFSLCDICVGRCLVYTLLFKVLNLGCVAHIQQYNTLSVWKTWPL